MRTSGTDISRSIDLYTIYRVELHRISSIAYDEEVYAAWQASAQAEALDMLQHIMN